MDEEDARWQQSGLPLPVANWHMHPPFAIGGIGILLRSSMPFSHFRMKQQLLEFVVATPPADCTCISHVFEMPELDQLKSARIIYQQPPWTLSQWNHLWIYACIAAQEHAPHCIAIFTDNYRHALIYHTPETAQWLSNSEWPSLALLPTDQIWLCQLVAERTGVLLHAAAVILDGNAFVFAGKSGAGKSTTIQLLREASCFQSFTILCDDRVIVRKQEGAWQCFGTWSHGTIPDVSAHAAPLKGIFLLEQAAINRLIKLEDPSQVMHALLAVLIRPLTTTQWWKTTLQTLDNLVNDSNAYTMQFDLSGKIVQCIRELPI